jgi:hypothetical protein
VTLLRAAGRRLAHEVPALRGDAAARANAVSAVLNDLGGLAVVRQHPKVCKAVEAMVGELAGATAREHCDRSDQRPRCYFQLGER